MIVDATELRRSLVDIESAVNAADLKGLQSSAGTWRIPRELKGSMFSVAASLVCFKPSPRLGKFLVVSGVDKSGKETHSFNQSKLPQITSVRDHLISLGFDVLPINLPSYDTLLGSLVGSYLGRRRGAAVIKGELGNDYAWLLWSLDRAQFNGEVDAWLAKGPRSVVLAKRWTESHVIYQSEAGVEPRRVIRFEEKVVKQDFTVVLDISPSTAMARLRTRPDRDNYEHASR